MKTQLKQVGNSTIPESDSKKQASIGTIIQAYKQGTAQLQTIEEEETAQRQENKTGLPDNLKSGVENLSGHSLDDVKVHYNSSQPASLQAHAYAQGTDIHVAPGQEKHLPHEAWHVVQQKQGRVQPTKQLKGTTNINDDQGLEKEADVMGAKAMQMKKSGTETNQLKNNNTSSQSSTLQRNENDDSLREVELSELPEEKARKHLVDSFKKGKMEAPLVNEAGQVVQRVPKKENHGGGELFTVLQSDLDTGTGTSKATREYVNAPSTPKPNSVLFDYASAKSAAKAKTEVIKNSLAFEVDNPEADNSYKSGSYWDAGHKLGKQNGGLGNDTDWVFPQNPALNQGNHRNMDDDSEETHPEWRAHEDHFYQGVNTDGGGVWWVKFT